MSASAFGERSFVYILRCADDSFYVGHTSDVYERVKVHNDGHGALWTACRRPVTVVYQESHPTEEQAVARERQLKRWTHAKKHALISGNQATLKALAKRRIP
jgi:predicted GIY-YIG superfamily endonuclease